MRKYLEKEMLAECLHGRIRYNATTYVGMDGFHLFEIYLDDQLVKRFSLETVNTYFIENGFKKESGRPYGHMEYWKDFWPLLDSTPVTARGEYTDEEFCDALSCYRTQPIHESITSENPLVRMFALLDRRIGKRTLVSVRETFMAGPEWLSRLYQVRLDAEHLA